MQEEFQLSTDLSKKEMYRLLTKQVESLFTDEKDVIANAANLSSLIFYNLPDLNWAGIYFSQGNELVVGPFQGKVACTRIPFAKGVCGTAAEQRQTIIVPDVHQFPGHIACDSASNSEIVVPILQDDFLLGVLDLDSPKLNRFDEEDARGLQHLIDVFIEMSDFFDFYKYLLAC